MRLVTLLVAMLAMVASPTEAPPDEAMAAVQAVVKGLDSVDFEAREESSKRLCDLPAEYASELLRMRTMDGISPEASDRLWSAARAIFDNKILTETNEWLSFMADPGVRFNMFLASREWPPSPADRECYDDFEKPSYLVVSVEEVDLFGSADGKLRYMDIITHIDGIPMEDVCRFGIEGNYDYDEHPMWARPGQRHVLTVMRAMDQEALVERGYWNTDDKFEKIMVEIVPGARMKIPQWLRDKMDEFRATKWMEFVLKAGGDPSPAR